MTDRSNNNQIFFSMLNYSLAEQENIDWAFKTSLIFVKGFDEELSQSPIQKQDQIDNIFEYLKEAKPYHTEFSGLTEQQSATQENANVNMIEIINPKTTIHYDRVSSNTDMDGFDTQPFDYEFDADGKELGFDNIDYRQQDLNNAANRIYFFYDPQNKDEAKDIVDLMNAKFKGLEIDGGAINLDEILFDTQFFEKFGFDVPANEAFYYIDSAPTLPFTEYGTLLDAAIGATDYGFLSDSVSSTLDWGSAADPISAPTTATHFPLPDAIFQTKKVVVYFDQADGSRAIADQPYDIVGLNVIFETPPPVGVTVHLAVIDYDYIYDKVYVSNEDWDPISGKEDVTLDGLGFLRPHWDRGHPEELVSTGIVENLDIRVYTNQAQVLGYDPGFDESPFDTLGFDLALDDITLTTGGGPAVSRESYYKSEIQDTYELKNFPQSNESFFLFEDGLLQDLTTDYTINWNDPVYEDSLRDDHITNPQITFVGAPIDTTKIDFLHYGLGGSPILKRKVFYNASSSTFDMDIQVPSANYVFATVDGVIATFTVVNQLVTINTPTVSNATVVIVVYSDTDFSNIKSQEETGTVLTLTNPPSSTIPGYMGIQAWNTTTGVRLNAPYIKVHAAKAGVDTYASSTSEDLTVAFSGNVLVYLNNVLQTIVTDYTLSGSDVVFTSIPSLGAEIIIIAIRDEEFALSTTTITNDTFTVGSSTALRIVTFAEDVSMGQRTECYQGNVTGTYDIGIQPTTDNDLWVYVDGVLMHYGVDYTINNSTPYEVQFINTFSHTGKVIQITYLIERASVPSLGFRMNKTPKGDIEYYRIADQHITELMGEYKSGLDQEILVSDASVLGQPSPKSVPPAERIPGKIWIGSEQIDFWGIDYSSVPHKLTALRPGNKATAMGLTHAVGSKVYDSSRKQLFPTKLTFSKGSQVRNYTQGTGVSLYSVPGIVSSVNDVKTWVTGATTLVNAFNPTDTIITVEDSSVLALPGASTLTTDIVTPVGSFFTGDALKIEINDGTVSEIINLSGPDIADLESVINGIPGLANRLLVASSTGDILTLTHSGGGSIVVSPSLGYAFYDLFGGQITGTVSTPTVTFGAGEGITINGIDVVFTASTLADVIYDITQAGIPNIVVRNKGDVLQIVHLEGLAITVADLVGTATAELGLTTSSASTLIIVNSLTGIPEVTGILSNTKGAIFFNQERVEFGYYDPSLADNHILGDFNRTFVDIPTTTTYPADTVMVGSNMVLQTKDVEYELFSNKLRFKASFIPEVGSLIRIQNKPLKSNTVIPDNIQRSGDIVTKFLLDKPGSLHE